MPRLDRLPQINRNNLLTFPAQVNDTAPCVALRTPLAECRLAIVTTAGLHRRGDRLFTPGEQTYRVIPSDTPAAEIFQSHTSLGFDRAPSMRDLNISVPVDRVLRRRPDGDEVERGRRRDRALVLGGDGGGPASPPRPRSSRRVRGPDVEGRGVRRRAVAAQARHDGNRSTTAMRAAGTASRATRDPAPSVSMAA